MQEKVKMFKQIVNEMADLYEKKNSNYGDSFGQLYAALGPVSGLVPLHNKLDRATSLIKGNKNNFESLEDTFKDLACYAIMNLIEMKMANKSAIDKNENDGSCYTVRPGLTYGWPNDAATSPYRKLNPCADCPWKNSLFDTLTVGDIPCQWCKYGPQLTCNHIMTTTTTTTTENKPDNITITTATTPTKIE